MPTRPPTHQRPGAKRHTFAVENRQATRALHTGSTAWRALRRKILVRDLYQCRVCGCLMADQVDHVNNDSHDNRPENLQAICASCHSRKTAAETLNKPR